MGNITERQFYQMKDQFGGCGSWAVWASQAEGGNAKSGVCDISVFDHIGILDQLHNDFVIVGLNISSPVDKDRPFGNFHSNNPNNTDYKMRHAFAGTPLWGSYMTDVLKYVCEVDSRKIAKNAKEYIDQIDYHANMLKDELSILGADRAMIITLGGLSENLTRFILNRHGLRNKITKIFHYAHYIGPDKYRQHVLDGISF